MSTISTSNTLSGIETPATGTYAIDASHSNLVVTARHLMVSKVRGLFSGVSGTITIADDPLASNVEVVVQADTIDTREPQRDAHLKAADFLDVENHPEITFRSTSVEQVKGERFRLAGELTIRGVTKPVVLDFDYQGTFRDPWGGTRLGFEAKGEIDREDWDITWNAALETGGVLVSKKLTFEFELQAVKQ
ncbi:MAG TPA: YceI family protein [Acidimicrobiales bacterium]|jgi:polyisoprenoid-binding protein YceI|nr:YceI family protein [Acidimicrobiales bacterium]